MREYSIQEKIDYLNRPYNCQGFSIDDYVEYSKDGKVCRGYIHCFREFGYNWFAWIYFDKSKRSPVESIFVDDLKKIEE